MSSHLDIIGSVIIAGMIILNFTVFMGERQESQIESTNKITTQTDMSEVTSTLRHDLRKVGYGCDSIPIITATSSTFAFRTDLDNNGKIDTVSYIFTPDLTNTTTKRLLLFRIVNGRKQPGYDLGLTDFAFKYYRTNSYGTLSETTSVTDIHAISVSLRLQSKMKVEDGYQYSQNEFTVSPKNL
jgi:hypothetical protein